MNFVPLPAEAFRCRRYLFDRSWCEELGASGEQPVSPGRPATDPRPEGWVDGMERRR